MSVTESTDILLVRQFFMCRLRSHFMLRLGSQFTYWLGSPFMCQLWSHTDM